MIRVLALGLVAAVPHIAGALFAVEEHQTAIEVSDLGFDLHIYAPKTGSTGALFPVIFFVSGFGGDVAVSHYSDTLSHIVAHGYVVVGLDHQTPHVPDYEGGGHTFHKIMVWAAEGNMDAVFKKKGISALPDVVERSIVMGQSAGNHIVGQALKDGCSVAKAFVMLDPVDGYDPYRFVRRQDLIKKGEPLPFAIPALILDNELDTTSKHWYFPACAPREMGADHWFNGWVGPVWNVNASKYGHLDCLDDSFIGGGICPTNASTDKAAYRRHLGETIALFLDGLLLAKPELLVALADASNFNVSVTVKQDLRGMAVDEIMPGCTEIMTVV